MLFSFEKDGTGLALYCDAKTVTSPKQFRDGPQRESADADALKRRDMAHCTQGEVSFIIPAAREASVPHARQVPRCS